MLVSPSDFRVKLERTSNYSRSTHPVDGCFGKNTCPFKILLVITRSGIFVPCRIMFHQYYFRLLMNAVKNLAKFKDLLCLKYCKFLNWNLKLMWKLEVENGIANIENKNAAHKPW